MSNKIKRVLTFLAVVSLSLTGCSDKQPAETIETTTAVTTTVTEISETTELTKEKVEEIPYMEQFKDTIVELPPEGYEEKLEEITYPGFEKYTYYSSTAGRDTNVNVLLPPDYSEDKEYPVLYILHGYRLSVS